MALTVPFTAFVLLLLASRLFSQALVMIVRTILPVTSAPVTQPEANLLAKIIRPRRVNGMACVLWAPGGVINSILARQTPRASPKAFKFRKNNMSFLPRLLSSVDHATLAIRPRALILHYVFPNRAYAMEVMKQKLPRTAPQANPFNVIEKGLPDRLNCSAVFFPR
jgi:hypothetical protein